jgi:hypothetical protein
LARGPLTKTSVHHSHFIKEREFTLSYSHSPRSNVIAVKSSKTRQTYRANQKRAVLTALFFISLIYFLLLRLPVIAEAVAAVHRLGAVRLERNSCYLTATVACGLVHLPVLAIPGAGKTLITIAAVLARAPAGRAP